MEVGKKISENTRRNTKLATSRGLNAAKKGEFMILEKSTVICEFKSCLRGDRRGGGDDRRGGKFF